ncbi:hypothetical protein KOY49_00920 [Candidatus Minimicrobia vallesae]|uniref:Methionyl-tRNA formyltransferase n=1 Tax=Candidatus Minimicrobia vallesae TaxID=2841264 RepID=A0A8F1SAG9_9BACT|nr:hypothetical protein [Candidatus Minimicrobia vallesae]QWQ31568.1 hypothetical protein KOY49_00920 [Candidatus Minimicrobia vallesae]
MTKISPKIVFFGTENYSLITLEALVEEGFNVVCVITKPDTKRGRGHKLTEPPVTPFANSAAMSSFTATLSVSEMYAIALDYFGDCRAFWLHSRDYHSPVNYRLIYTGNYHCSSLL